MEIGIIGGGAAGFFAALNAKENYPESTVVILEKTKKLLSKVSVSGGGRCNVTNACKSIAELSKAYPRGGKQLKKIFPQFNTIHIREWFECRNVPLYVQDDQRVFPVSNDSQTIIDCLLEEAYRLGIIIKKGANVNKIKPLGDQFYVYFDETNHSVYDKVIVASGGSPKKKGLQWLADLGHKIEDPVPSLFTFNMPNEDIKKLMGVVVQNVTTKIQGGEFQGKGPLLITHWGMSGPAILVLSAFAARHLATKNYQFSLHINWTNEQNQAQINTALQDIIAKHGQKQLQNIRPYELPQRLWLFILEKVGYPLEQKWDEIGKKGVNKLIEVLSNDIYTVRGKTTFKEEFVTCGGVCLNDINMQTMESKKIRGLFFAGEVIDIDAITGGYNFQAAWTTGYIAGKLGKK